MYACACPPLSTCTLSVTAAQRSACSSSSWLLDLNRAVADHPFAAQQDDAAYEHEDQEQHGGSRDLAGESFWVTPTPIATTDSATSAMTKMTPATHAYRSHPLDVGADTTIRSFP